MVTLQVAVTVPKIFTLSGLTTNFFTSTFASASRSFFVMAGGSPPSPPTGFTGVIYSSPFTDRSEKARRIYHGAKAKSTE